MYKDNSQTRKLNDIFKRVNAINPSNGERQTVKEDYIFSSFRRGYALLLSGVNMESVAQILLDVYNEIDCTEYEDDSAFTSIDVIMARKYMDVRKEFEAYVDFRRDSGADSPE